MDTSRKLARKDVRDLTKQEIVDEVTRHPRPEPLCGCKPSGTNPNCEMHGRKSLGISNSASARNQTWKDGVTWRVDNGGNGQLIATTADCHLIVAPALSSHTRPTPEQDKANARLIAAAPEMAAKLRELNTWLICPDTSRATLDEWGREIYALLARIDGTAPAGKP